jgi:predicted nucleotidyltransferase
METIFEDVLRYLKHSNINVLNIYLFGSRVYGTNNEKSDYDFIVVADGDFTKIDSIEFYVNNIECNATIYSVKQFQRQIELHEISVLECLFCDTKYKKELINFNFVLDKNILRHSISAKCSNSWSVCNKKLTVENNVRRAMKSLFHVFRIYTFAIELLETNKIFNFSAANHIYNKIMKLTDFTWDDIKQNYQKDRNALATNFKKLINN